MIITLFSDMTTRGDSRNFARRFLFVVAALLIAASVGLGLLAESISWPDEAESLKPILLQGLGITRIGLILMGGLTLLTPFWLRQPDVDEQGVEQRNRPRSLIWPAILFALTAPLSWEALSQSLIWDELNTLTRVVHRGPRVIAAWSNDADAPSERSERFAQHGGRIDRSVVSSFRLPRQRQWLNP